jgi:hypothetical protein
MAIAQKISDLVDKYIEQIEIENAGFVPFDNAVSDAAYLLLNVPIEMLRNYLRLRGQKRELPDGAEFWKETCLVRRLRDSDKCYGKGDAPLEDVLDYLEGAVQCHYQELSTPGKIRLSITEIPEVEAAP